MIAVRSLLFYVGYICITVVWGTLSLLIGGFLSFENRFDFIVRRWTALVLWWLKMSAGIRVNVTGTVPTEVCVVFVKHASTWETLFVQQLFKPQATLVKRELLNIPFFGWSFRLLQPIAIDRTNPRASLKSLIQQGKARLAAGVWVVLFPEGTRSPKGQQKPFQVGGAALAKAAGCPVIVVAHNASEHWPAHEILKQPGTIEVELSPLIETAGRSSKEINEAAQDWLRAAQSRLET